MQLGLSQKKLWQFWPRFWGPLRRFFVSSDYKKNSFLAKAVKIFIFIYFYKLKDQRVWNYPTCALATGTEQDDFLDEK